MHNLFKQSPFPNLTDIPYELRRWLTELRSNAYAAFLDTHNEVTSLDSRIAAVEDDFIDWTDFTPAWGNFTPGNGTLHIAKYRQHGKLVKVRLIFTLGSTSSITGTLTLTYPVGAGTIVVPAGTALGILGWFQFGENGVNTWQGNVTFNTSSTVRFLSYTVASSKVGRASVTATVPVASPGASDFLDMYFEYELP